MRHGVAVERDEWTGDDFSRPLTPDGHDKTLAAARGLAAFCGAPDVIATSPKVRALQTAEIAQDAWRKKSPPQIWPELAEDNFEAWLVRLRKIEAKSVVLVGHQPDFSRFASLLLSADAEELEIVWKKAGVMALDLDLPNGHVALQWMLPPRFLRLVGA